MAILNVELPAFDSNALGSTSSVKVDIFRRLLQDVDVQIIGSGPSSAEPIVSNFVEYVDVMQDTDTKSRYSPALQRKLDSIQNLTGDTLSPSYMRIPFAHVFHPWSQWGGADIGELTLAVKLKDSLPANNTFTRLRARYRYRPVEVAVPRGDVLIQGIVPITGVSGGWNTVNDLPWNKVVALTKLILDADAITQVKVKIGDTYVYDSKKTDVRHQLQHSPQYKEPSIMDFFPVILDDAARVDDFHYTYADENGRPARRAVQLEYYWDTNVASAASFNVLAQGLDRGTKVAPALAKV